MIAARPGWTSCTSVTVVAPAENRCPLDILSVRGVDATQAQRDAAANDPRCDVTESFFYSSQFSGPPVGGYDDFVQLTGLESPTARRILDQAGSWSSTAARSPTAVGCWSSAPTTP